MREWGDERCTFWKLLEGLEQRVPADAESHTWSSGGRNKTVKRTGL